MSYTQLLYHVIFRTKHGNPTISEAHEKELYAYIWGIVSHQKSVLYRIGGTANHLHLLVSIHPAIAVARFVQKVKEYSSKWLLSNPHFPDFEAWAVGYAAFSYSIKEKQTIFNYIARQKEHHRATSFEDECRALLMQNGIEGDGKDFLMG